MNGSWFRNVSVLSAPLVFTALSAFGQSSTPKAESGYRLSVFAKGVTGQYTAPDSIAVLNGYIFIGYGDGNEPAGLDGKSNYIVQYTRAGVPVYAFSVKGHNDGLKVNPYTGKLWVLQNEDGNASLVIFDPELHTRKTYAFASAGASGGGYDDMVFKDGKVYVSASNPQNNPNNQPAIVEAKLVGNQVEVTAVLEGNAAAKNVLTGQTVTLNLQDPDSMTLSPTGDLVLDSQGDSELIVVRQPGSTQQSAVQIPLSSPYGQPQVDDTLFTPSQDGFILVTDTAANTTYKIEKALFTPGAAYSAGVAGSSAAPGFVGRLDMEFGQLTPVVSGLQSPHGLAFVKTVDDDSALDKLKEKCLVLFPNL